MATDLVRELLGCTELELYSQTIASLEALKATKPSHAVPTIDLAIHIGEILKRDADAVAECLCSYPMQIGSPVRNLMFYVGDATKPEKRDWHDYEWFVSIAKTNEHGRLF